MATKLDMEAQLEKAAYESYYMNPDMIRFLLAENLALKTLLHEKGLVAPEEYKRYQAQAMEVLDRKVKDQVDAWRKTNPVAKMFKTLAKTEDSPNKAAAEASACSSVCPDQPQ